MQDKSNILVLILGCIILVGAFWLGSNKHVMEAHKVIMNERYQLSCNFIDGKGKTVDYYVYPDGRYAIMTTEVTGEKSKETGYLKRTAVDEFMKLAVSHKINEMDGKMKDDNIVDGNTIFFNMIVGEDYYFFGGYSPETLSEDFEAIWESFTQIPKEKQN